MDWLHGAVKAIQCKTDDDFYVLACTKSCVKRVFGCIGNLPRPIAIPYLCLLPICLSLSAIKLKVSDHFEWYICNCYSGKLNVGIVWENVKMENKYFSSFNTRTANGVNLTPSCFIFDVTFFQ